MSPPARVTVKSAEGQLSRPESVLPPLFRISTARTTVCCPRAMVPKSSVGGSVPFPTCTKQTGGALVPVPLHSTPWQKRLRSGMTTVMRLMDTPWGWKQTVKSVCSPGFK